MNDHPSAIPLPVARNGARPLLTNRQLSVVHDLAQGWDISTVAAHRGRSLSSTYEIAGRICDRLDLADWSEIGPYARGHGLVEPDGWQNPEYSNGSK